MEICKYENEKLTIQAEELSGVLYPALCIYNITPAVTENTVVNLC
jgi:hypothetical protein